MNKYSLSIISNWVVIIVCIILKKILFLSINIRVFYLSLVF